MSRGACPLPARPQHSRANGPVPGHGSCAALRWPVRGPHGSEAIDVGIRNQAPIRVACIRDAGPLPEVQPCFERLFRWAGVIEVPTGRVLTLSFQRPGSPPRRWYWKVAVELYTHERPPPGIELDAVDGGRYGLYRLVGPHEGIGTAYRRLFDEWLPGSGQSVLQRPCVELYRNTPGETAPENLVTDLCVPLKKPRAGQGTDG